MHYYLNWLKVLTNFFFQHTENTICSTYICVYQPVPFLYYFNKIVCQTLKNSFPSVTYVSLCNSVSKLFSSIRLNDTNFYLSTVKSAFKILSNFSLKYICILVSYSRFFKWNKRRKFQSYSPCNDIMRRDSLLNKD